MDKSFKRLPSAGLSKTDFNVVAMSSLKKYKSTHKIRAKSTMSKMELAEAISKHFASLPPPSNELDIIEAFAVAVKSNSVLSSEEINSVKKGTISGVLGKKKKSKSSLGQHRS